MTEIPTFFFTSFQKSVCVYAIETINVFKISGLVNQLKKEVYNNKFKRIKK